MPPEVYGCFSLLAVYTRRREDAWKKGNEYQRKKYKRKWQQKIDKTVSKAVRLLADRGLSVDAVVPEYCT